MRKIFDFRCEDCGNVFEDLITTEELDDKLYGPCPECQSVHISKLLSTHSSHFSWETWRTPVTDYY